MTYLTEVGSDWAGAGCECLTNKNISPLNFLGGLLRSPASGCTTHRSSTRLEQKERNIKATVARSSTTRILDYCSQSDNPEKWVSQALFTTFSCTSHIAIRRLCGQIDGIRIKYSFARCASWTQKDVKQLQHLLMLINRLYRNRSIQNGRCKQAYQNVLLLPDKLDYQPNPVLFDCLGAQRQPGTEARASV